MNGRPYETLKPPPIETLGVAYLAPIMAPLRVLTRIPPNNPNAETVPANTFIRIEASSGYLISGSILFDNQMIIQSYAPYNDEVTSESNLGTALAWMGNAQGTTITAAGYDWFVTYSWQSTLPYRVVSEDVPMSCYRAAVTWRIAGQPLSLPARS